ncbi:MAG TPA: RHS repeat-associated core domain-containing protein [Candidatus Angelobacter sp.]|nr:RHS repeat-associated core domain-containing protein [Candidatus Angelobacter sp.]
MTRKILVTIAVLLMSACAIAQIATDPQPFASYGGGPFDLVNLGSLNVNFNIPIVQKTGRGAPFFYNLSYNNLIWSPVTVNGARVWQPSSTSYGWQPQTNAGLFGFLSFSTTSAKCPSPSIGGTSTTFYNFVYHDSTGGTHPMVGADSGFDCNENVFADPGASEDGTGLTLTTQPGTPFNGTITRRDGSVVSNPGVSTPSYVDTNGNKITTDGTNFFDTLGATALTISGTAPNPVTYTSPNSSGGNSVITAKYTSFTIQTNFGCSGTAEYSAAGNLISSLTLADGTQYQFAYEQTPGQDATHTTGRIASVTLPSTGQILYSYTGGNNGISCLDGTTPTLTRTLKSAPPATEGVWTYTRSLSGSTWNTTITDPANNQSALQFDGFNGGFYEVNRKVYQGSVSGNNLLLSVTRCYNGDCINALGGAVSSIDIWTQPAGLASAGHTGSTVYNAFGLPTRISAGDFDSTNLSNTTITYAAPGNGIVDRPSDIVVTDGSGTKVAETVISYDETPLTATSSAPGHDYTNFASTFKQRGNPTTVKQWVSGTTYLTATNTYDDLGNLRSFTDPGGHKTTFDYTDSYSDGQNHNAQAFVTTTTLPQTANAGGGSPFTHVSKNKFYWPSGLLYQATDQNNQVTAYTYDNLSRPLSISYPDGGQTTYTYFVPGGIGPGPGTEIQRQIDSTAGNTTTYFLLADGFNRTSRTGSTNGNEPTGQYDQTDVCYNSLGQVSFTPYAYQSSGTGGKRCDPTTYAGDSFAYDALGRQTSVTHSDGTSVLATYTGRAVQVQDEGNGSTHVTHIYQRDALGRTKTVCEVASTIFGTGTPGACGLDITGNPVGVTTTYAYNPQGQVTQVSQGSLIARSFTYDGVGHLLTETIPEAGGTQTSYTYNSAGLLSTRTRPSANQPASCIAQHNCTTTTKGYAYDELNRLRLVSYTGPENTNSLALFYDDPSAFLGGTFYNNGRLSAAATEDHNFTVAYQFTNFGYDKMGRVLVESQLPNATRYPVNYSYNLLGLPATLNTQGTTLTYSYNQGARLTKVASSVNDSTHPGTLFSAAHYNASGELLSDSLGNGVNETFNFDARWRLLSASAVKNSATLYNLSGSGAGNSMTYAPNSSLSGANDSVNGSWTYSYDALNRLAGANKSGGTSFTFDVDRNANRWHQNPVGQGAQLGFNAGTNQIASGNGVTYDALGDIINDGIHSYTYDAEGRITQVDGGSTATYQYDVFGRRTRRTVNGVGYEDVYDQSGNMVTEVQTSGLTVKRQEIYAPGRHLATYANGATYFSHADWAGSERVRSASDGTSAGTCTSNTYGDNYSCTGTDPSPIKYAGMEYDSETQLNHTWFRYYNPRLGLWMTPDPAGSAAADIKDPQSLNRYSYVLNNPLNLIDPLGLDGEELVFSGANGNLPTDYVTITVEASCGDDCSSLAFIGPPSGGGGGGFISSGGGGGGGGDATNTATIAQCAAAFGDKYSLASAVKALGNAVGVNANNAVVNGFLGNDVSTFSNLLFGPNSGSAAGGLLVSNPTNYNLAAVGVKAVGALPNPLAAQKVVLGFTSNGAAYGSKLVNPTIAESILGKAAGGLFAEFTAAKLALDAATYAAGLLNCHFNGH